jgi:hypothetical protein
MIKEIKVKADIIVKFPDGCDDVDKALLELEVALNTYWQVIVQKEKRVGLRFHFNEREE